MSFRTKTIVLMILLSLCPYVITMAILGGFYRQDVQARLEQNMQDQLDVTLARIDQHLVTLLNDMAFIASLDIMNDVLSGDIDRRIMTVLLQKKADLQLSGDFHVLDEQGLVVASTSPQFIGAPYTGKGFITLPVHSTFSEEAIGALLVDFQPENLTRYFNNNNAQRYALLFEGNVIGDTFNPDASLLLESPLSTRPDISVRLSMLTESAFADLDNFTRSFTIAMLMGIVVIATIAILLANSILKPVLLISTTARQITDSQDYDKRVELDRRDEIGQLATDFNSMIGSMKNMLARLQAESENRLKLVQEKNRAEMLQTLSGKLAKYLSPQIVESIFSGEKDVTLGSSRKKLTIFFSDIVGFTDTTDKMESEDLTGLLNSYLDEMTAIALRYGATVDKYIGDAIMIFFGDPHSQGVAEDARLCVEMALAMQQRVQALSEVWRNNGYVNPFRIRIGIHTGYCTVGNFGAENRMDYTIVGSAVNLASRIESQAQAGTVTISEDTWLLIRERFPCSPAASFVPKGMTSPVQLFEVLDPAAAARVVRADAKGLHVEYQPDQLPESALEALKQLLDKAGRHDN
jgi:class 3 adenylate cyclase/HAMP domain-containing protein